jgi:hypothetical protein
MASTCEGTSASGWPRHSASASASWADARSQAPALAAACPAACSTPNWATSSSPAPTSIRYPAGRVTIRSYPDGPKACRSRLT